MKCKKNPSSRAVPLGMEVYRQDEFNDQLLNRNKWTTNYFSSLNYLNAKSRDEMLQDHLPQPAYTLNGSAINLYVDDTIPKRINENRKMNFFDGDHILILLSGTEVTMKVYRD